MSFKDVTFLSKKAQLAFMFESSTISLKTCNTPFKETQLPFVWKGQHCLKEMLTKIESAASFESYTMIWKYVTMLSITPFLCKYVTLLLKNSSCTLLGQEHHLFQGTVSFLILRNLKPKETKRNKKNKNNKRNNALSTQEANVFQTCLNMPI